MRVYWITKFSGDWVDQTWRENYTVFSWGICCCEVAILFLPFHRLSSSFQNVFL